MSRSSNIFSQHLLENNVWSLGLHHDLEHKKFGFFHELGPGEYPGALDQDADNYVDWSSRFKYLKSARIVKIEA